MCSLESYPILSVAPGQPVNTRLLQLGEISTQIRTVTGGGGRLRRRGVCQKHVHQKAAVDVNFKFCIFFQKIDIRKLCMNRRLEKHGKYEIYSSILINVFLSNAWTSVLPWNRVTF